MALAMQFFYGNYQHAPKSVSFRSIQKSYILGQNQRTHMIRWNWGLRCKLVSAGGSDPQVDLLNQLTLLIAAYSTNGNSAGFPGTPFIMDTNQAIGGVLVTEPINHGKIAGAELTTYVYCDFALQADFPAAQNGQILAFNETTSFQDQFGEPMTVNLLPQNGPPIIQQVSTQSWYYGSQSGSCTTAFQVAPFEPPLFPSLLDTSSGKARSIDYQSPVMERGVPISYTTSWKYQFISAQPFFSYPNVQG